MAAAAAMVVSTARLRIMCIMSITKCLAAKLARALLVHSDSAKELRDMARHPKRMPWRYDEKTQTFTTPAGKVTLQELAEARYALGVGRVGSMPIPPGFRPARLN